MKRRINANRKLRAESLESRQMLHGGAMAGGAMAEAAEPPTTAERVETVFVANDANEDSLLSQDEVSERLWNRISDADANGDDAISTDELTAHIDARAADRVESGNGARGRAGNHERGENRLTNAERLDDFFADNDANEDGVLTADEVSERAWERLSTADLDDNGVSIDEVLAQQEIQHQERFDAAFAELDANDDGGVTVDEVSERKWDRISNADTNEDGSVAQDELGTYLESQRAERDAERETDDEATDGVGVGDEVGEPVGPAAGQAAGNGGQRGRRAGRRGR